jgi:hypothetical protein
MASQIHLPNLLELLLTSALLSCTLRRLRSVPLLPLSWPCRWWEVTWTHPCYRSILKVSNNNTSPLIVLFFFATKRSNLLSNKGKLYFAIKGPIFSQIKESCISCNGLGLNRTIIVTLFLCPTPWRPWGCGLLRPCSCGTMGALLALP